jgi:hypothetical protein
MQEFHVSQAWYCFKVRIKAKPEVLYFVWKSSLQNSIIFIIGYIKSRIQHAATAEKLLNLPVIFVVKLGPCHFCIHKTLIKLSIHDVSMFGNCGNQNSD